MDSLYDKMTKARYAFFGSLLVSACGLVIIQWLPKDQQEHGFRLGLTLLFFFCLLTLIGSLTKPLRDYLQARAAWTFDDAGPSLQHAAKLFAHGCSGYVAGFAYALMALATLTMLLVLAGWQEFDFLNTFRGILQPAWWIALLAVPAYLLATSGRLAELRQRRESLTEQMMVLGFEPPAAGVAEARRKAADASPVIVTRPLAFQAGGFEWQWSDFYKNAVVFGQVGSGKTVCVLNALLDGLLASADRGLPPAGLILDPKGDFRGKIETLCRRYGRENDLLIIDPTRPDKSIRWNPLDSPDDEYELASRFAAVLEILEQKEAPDSYWPDTARTFLQNAIAFIRGSNPPGVPPDLRDILPIAAAQDDILLERGERISSDDYNATTALIYLSNSWKGLSEKTRSIVQSYINNMISPFLLPPYNQLFSGKSTVTMGDIVDSGKILYIDMPIADKERMARTVSALAKLEFAREVLKRLDKPRLSFFLCDEFQSFFTSGQGKGDAEFFSLSRQSNHANLIATQTMPSLLKQAKNPHPVDTLLAGCATKIFLRNTDSVTNEWASRLFGEQLVQTSTFSRGGLGLGRSSGASSGSTASTQTEKVVRPEDFIRLGQPDRDAGILTAESIVHFGARAAVSREKLSWRVHPIRSGA